MKRCENISLQSCSSYFVTEWQFFLNNTYDKLSGKGGRRGGGNYLDLLYFGNNSAYRVVMEPPYYCHGHWYHLHFQMTVHWMLSEAPINSVYTCDENRHLQQSKHRNSKVNRESMINSYYQLMWMAVQCTLIYSRLFFSNMKIFILF